MTKENLIKNYAVALFNNAKAENSENVVLEQITIITQAIDGNTTLKKTMCSPIVDKHSKIQIINILIQNMKINMLLQNFLLLLVKNSRMFILTEIMSAYNNLLYASKNIKLIKIVSATALQTEEKQWLKTNIEEKLQQKTELIFFIDPTIIGGIIIKYDSMLQDCSIKGNLNKIARTLKNTKMVWE